MTVRCVLLIALLVVVQGVVADDSSDSGAGRVVAIADIHGAFDAMVATLQAADVIDESLAWEGGATRLVIVGDILDRGPRSRDAMDLLMRLEVEAQQAGGQVDVLIGNHESMLLIGDMRYVSKLEYAAFADDETSDERDLAFARFAARQGSDTAGLREVFDKEFPAGYFAMRRAFRPDGKYGQWLLSKRTLLVINGTAFVHGGLSPLAAELGVAGLNAQVSDVLRRYTAALAVLNDAGVLLITDSSYDHESGLDSFVPALDTGDDVLNAVAELRKVVDDPILSSDGPLWYRDNVRCQGVIEKYSLMQALSRIGAMRLVVGHTPTRSRQIWQRFDGRLLEIDTGMLANYYKGSGNALILKGDEAVTVSQDGTIKAVIDNHPRWVGRRENGLTTAQLENLLRDGEVVAVESAMTEDYSLVTVADGSNSVKALFATQKHKGNLPAVAAYRIDRLLGVEQVPVTVSRELKGEIGSLQFLPDSVVNEQQRAGGVELGAACSLTEQWMAMGLFDYLTQNSGRSVGNILYDRSSGNVILSENASAFARRSGGKLNTAQISNKVLTAWQQALAALTDAYVEAELEDVLDRRRRAALLKRRDRLLAEAEAAR